MFILVIEVAGIDLFIGGIGLLIISLSLVSLTWFSAIGDITDCEAGIMRSVWCYSCIYSFVEFVDHTLSLKFFQNFNNWISIYYQRYVPLYYSGKLTSVTFFLPILLMWCIASSIKLSTVLIFWTCMLTEWLLLYCVKMKIYLYNEIYQKTKLENYKIMKYLLNCDSVTKFIKTNFYRSFHWRII